MKEAAGESRGRPVVWRFEAERESFDGRYGKVVAIFGVCETIAPGGYKSRSIPRGYNLKLRDRPSEPMVNV